MSTAPIDRIRSASLARSPSAPRPDGAEPEAEGLDLPRQTTWSRNQDAILGMLGIVAVLIAWELSVNAGLVRPNWVSSPSRIIATVPTVFFQDNILAQLQISSVEFFWGFGLAVLVGVPLGVLTGWYRTIRGLTEPLISALFATPTVALVPILILIFGIDAPSKAAVVFLSSVWPIVINTSAGIQVLDKGWLDAARTFGANDARIFRTIGLPATIPFIISGLRTAVARGLVGVVVGELYASKGGIGFYLNRAGQTFQTDKYYVAVTIIALIGVLVVFVLQRLEKRFARWRIAT
jgi:ABC-type nitrate/sulfonate/bicarbonate transport system permease component